MARWRLFAGLLLDVLRGGSLWPGNADDPRPSLWWEIGMAWRVTRILYGR